jgi:hypothetical protein
MIVGRPDGTSPGGCWASIDQSVRTLGTKVTRQELHKEMLCCIADFESLMAEVEDSLPPITKQDVIEIKKAIAILKALPAGRISVGDYGGARHAKTTLKRIAFGSAGLTVSVGFALMRLTRSVINWLHKVRYG